MQTLVVGAGEIGRWLAATLTGEVAVVDAEPAAAEAAIAEVDDVRAVPRDTEETFDLVALAVPMPAVEDAVAEWAPAADRAMIDVAGEMAGPLAAMREHLPDRERASLHPLFAPPRAPGRVPIVDEGDSVVDAVREDLAAAGNEVFDTTAAEHDAAMETVQAKAHAAVLAYALAGDDVPPAFQTPVSADLSALTETVLSGRPEVYADIQDAFDGAEEVAEAAADLAAADHAAFVDLYREARDRSGASQR